MGCHDVTSCVLIDVVCLQNVIRQHSEALQQASQLILKKETLTGDELAGFMKQYPPTEPATSQVRLQCSTWLWCAHAVSNGVFGDHVDRYVCRSAKRGTNP